MKHIRLFSVVLLIAVLAIVVAAWACDNLETTRDDRQKFVDAVEYEIRGREINNHWLERL